MYEVFSDGACIGNPGPGGWAYIIRNAKLGINASKSGGEPATTNNRMELLAVISCFEDFNLNPKNKPSAFTVYSDSKYVVDAFRQKWLESWMKRGWKTADKKPVKNKDLWERMVEATESHTITWEWVKAHAGHPENEECDRMATQAAAMHARS